jgi:thymidylate kinase
MILANKLSNYLMTGKTQEPESTKLGSRTDPGTLKQFDQGIHASKWISGPIRRPKDFLSTLFSALDSNKVRYCVLHSWEELPEKLSSDLDIAVHPGDICNLPSVFRLLKEAGYIPIQVFNYFVNAYYFVFSWFEGAEINYVAVDLIFEHRRGGLIVPSGEEIVSDRRRQSVFWIPAPESEFTYLLAKKTWKAAVPAKQARRLRTLIEELGRHKAERLAGQLFLGKLRARVVEACASGCVDGLLTQIRTQTWKTSLVRNPLRLTAYLLSDAVRRVRRWLQPTGLFVVVMGPDGAGKSTLIENLVQAVGPAFRRHRVFHWRPMLLWRRKAARDTTQPHSLPPHACWWSIVRLFGHLLDYWLGYWLVIRPLLARSGMVVFDRYYHDLLVDPKRYQFGGPLYLVRFMSRLVPKPDLVLILDAPLDVILSRKQEVPPEDVLSQKRAYLQMASRFSQSLVIDSAARIAQVAAQAGQAVLEYLAQRLERRHPHRLLGPSCSSRPGLKELPRRLFNE